MADGRQPRGRFAMAETQQMVRYAVTDRRRIDSDEITRTAALVHQVEQLSRQRVDYLQLREKDLSFAEAAALAVHLQRVATALDSGMRVLLNAPWSAETAAAWPAGVGVHLSSASLQTLSAKAGMLLRHTPVSAACHSVREALQAAEVADLLLFAPVFEKRVSQAVVCEGAGLDLLCRVCAAVAPVPVLAMGGVTLRSAAACVEAGAAGVAGIRLFQIDG